MQTLCQEKIPFLVAKEIKIPELVFLPVLVLDIIVVDELTFFVVYFFLFVLCLSSNISISSKTFFAIRAATIKEIKSAIGPV